MSFSKTVVIPVTPDAAFDLITQPERLRRWQAIAARVDLRVGGEFRWTVVPGKSATGTFTEIEPGKRIVFTWDWTEPGVPVVPGGSTIAITMEEADGGTAVTLRHDGLAPEDEAGHAEGWTHYLGRLAAIATTGDAGADPWTLGELDRLTSADAALAIAQRVLAGLTEKDMGRQTPCEDFTVAQLVDHLEGSIGSIATALGVAAVEPSSAAPEVRIAELSQRTLEAFAARGLEGTLDMGFAEVPATIMANILSIEFLVHAWDFSAAAGRTLEVDPKLSGYVLELARETISPQVRQNGSFADETVVEESAGSLERLIAFTGRTVDQVPTGA